MAEMTDIGHRVELVPMDTHFHDITIALYQQVIDERPMYCVHSYSSINGAAERLEGVRAAMMVLGEMQAAVEDLLQFPCGHDHVLPIRRLFLESCKIPPDEEPTARPLQIFDKKAGTEVAVAKLGNGTYEVHTDSDYGVNVDKRLRVIAGGLVKLGQLEATDAFKVTFECGHDHDALLGLLLVRAPNVRAAVREQEQLATRGVLSAPSQQE